MTSPAHKFATARTLPLAALAKDYLTAGALSQVTTTTLAALSLATLSLRANSIYRFNFEGVVAVSVATSTIGLGVALTGGTPTNLGITEQSPTGAMVTQQALATACVEGAARAIGSNGVRLFGYVQPSANGNFQITAQRSGTGTVFIFGTLEVIET